MVRTPYGVPFSLGRSLLQKLSLLTKARGCLPRISGRQDLGRSRNAVAEPEPLGDHRAAAGT